MFFLFSRKGFKPDDITILHLWSVLEEFNDHEKSLFLGFSTGCSRPPTLVNKFKLTFKLVYNVRYSVCHRGSSISIRDFAFNKPTPSSMANIITIDYPPAQPA
jgi:hypothetical protein